MITTEQTSYRSSHRGKGRDYHACFSEIPRIATVWKIERRILADVMRRFFAGRDVDHLDFACGTGRILTYLEDFVRSSTGVDVAASMLEIAERLVKHAGLVEGDITRAAVLGQEKYDLITAFRFFPNAEDGLRDEAVRALVKHLKPNGYLVFNNHKNASSLKYRLMNLMKGHDAHDRRMSHAETVRLVRSAGLTIRKRYHVGILPETDKFFIRPRLPVQWIESAASRLPLTGGMSEDLIYVCSRGTSTDG